MKAAGQSLRRIGNVARFTLLCGARQRLPLCLFVLAAGCALGGAGLRELDFGQSEMRFIADFGFGAITMFGSALAIVSCSRFYLGEIEDGTASVLLGKPLDRAEHLLGKLAGCVAITTVFCAAMTLLILVSVQFRVSELRVANPGFSGYSEEVTIAGIAVTGTALGLKLAVLDAFTILVASISRSSLFAMAASLGVLVCGHLRHIVDNGAGREPGLPALVGRAVMRTVPDFQVFELGDLQVPVNTLDAGLLARVAGYGLFYATVAGGMAALCSRSREIH